MRVITIIKATVLLTICILMVIPSWINYLQPGVETIQIDELISGSKKLGSLNLKISGKPLFEFSCRYEDYDKDGRLKNVLYYVPLVSMNWIKGEGINALLILDSGKREWDAEFDSAVKALDLKVDSLKTIKGNFQIQVAYHKYDFYKFEDKAMSCLSSEHNLKLADNSDIRKLVFNEKHSLFGKISVTCCVAALMTIIYIKLK